MSLRITPEIAAGQTNPEYVTVILELCGINEAWTLQENNWVSSHPELRKRLEQLVELIKRRVVKNVKDWQEMERAHDIVMRFLEE